MKAVKIIIGAAVACALLAAGTAGAASLITGKQIKNGTVTGKDVKDRSLTAKELRGPIPIDAAKGHWVEANYSIPAGTIDIVDAVCPPGEAVVAGGWFTTGNAFVDDSYDGTSWSVGVDAFDNASAADTRVKAWCVRSDTLIVARSGSTRRADLAAQRAAH